MTAWRLPRWITLSLPSITKPATTPRTAPPEITWSTRAPTRCRCPNCLAVGPKPSVLTVAFRALHQPHREWELRDCPDCGCRFFAEALPGTSGTAEADYAGDEMLSRGRAALYVQHGAGLAQLIRPIARLAQGAPLRMLDIGCGFGFGLDFAIRHFGWSCLGIDPAQIAALGRDLLDLPIEQRLLGADEPAMRGAFDVVMAAETIEHVPDPVAFLAILVSALAPSGILVLTTPDAGAIHPNAPLGQLVGVLSPGLHVVLQSERSLRRLLAEAGLTHVHIERDGGALVATASRNTLTLPAGDDDFRRVYLDYLVNRAGAFTQVQDLFWGFAGRAFLEAVNSGAWADAQRMRDRLASACQQRFALSLDHPSLFEETAVCSLERMAALMPLNFGVILYADAMLALGQGARRSSQQARFEAAAEALRRLRRAIGELGMADPMSEEIGWASQAESLVCAADGAPQNDLISRLAALPPAPGDHGFGRRETMRFQAFVTLVHAAQYGAARTLAEIMPELSAPRTQQGQDAVFCRAVLALQPPGDPGRAHDDFAWLRDQLSTGGVPTDMALFWSALRGEAQALDLLGQPQAAAALLHETLSAMAARGEAIPTDLALAPGIDL